MLKRLKNWKTSGVGVGALLMLVGNILTDPSSVDWNTALPTLVSGLMLLLAKD